MMSDDQILEVVQAHKEGKDIQMLRDGQWLPVQVPAWNFSHNNYRVAPATAGKPQPREWSVHVTKDAYPHEMITSFPAHQDSIKETIRVREVLGDSESAEETFRKIVEGRL